MPVAHIDDLVAIAREALLEVGVATADVQHVLVAAQEVSHNAAQCRVAVEPESITIMQSMQVSHFSNTASVEPTF